MITFTEINQPAKLLGLHYAKQLKNEFAEEVIKGDKDVSSKEEAIEFTNFFWQMTDQAVIDQENENQVAGIHDLEFWMEKLMNITIGYLSSCGYKDQWTIETNRINGHA